MYDCKLLLELGKYPSRWRVYLNTPGDVQLLPKATLVLHGCKP